MKQFRFAIDTEKAQIVGDDNLKFFKEDNGKKVFESFLVQAITTRFKDGLGGKKQRIYGRILAKLDEAETDSIKLESDEYEFIKDMFIDESARFQAGQTRVVMQYIYNIETVCEV